MNIVEFSKFSVFPTIIQGGRPDLATEPSALSTTPHPTKTDSSATSGERDCSSSDRSCVFLPYVF